MHLLHGPFFYIIQHLPLDVNQQYSFIRRLPSLSELAAFAPEGSGHGF